MMILSKDEVVYLLDKVDAEPSIALRQLSFHKDLFKKLEEEKEYLENNE